jgi:hypothetical protein
MTNAVQTIIETIRTSAASKGQFLHRYQTNANRGVKSVVFAIHSSESKPSHSKYCDGVKASLTHLEGSTENCEAYRELSKMLESMS